MLVIRDPDQSSTITDPDIRELIDQRFIDMSDGEDYEVDLQVIVVEVGDVDDREAADVLLEFCERPVGQRDRSVLIGHDRRR